MSSLFFLDMCSVLFIGVSNVYWVRGPSDRSKIRAFGDTVKQRYRESSLSFYVLHRDKTLLDTQ